MKREDICTIVKDVASQFGYEYRDHLGLIYLTKGDDEIEVCCCHEQPQSINLFSRVFDFDPSFTSDDIINLLQGEEIDLIDFKLSINNNNSKFKICYNIITPTISNNETKFIENGFTLNISIFN